MIPYSLQKGIENGLVIPFIGSGVSRGVSPAIFPTWTSLIERLAVRLEGEVKPDDAEKVRKNIRGGKLIEAADAAVEHLGNSIFHDVMKETFNVKQPADANLQLPAAIWNLKPKLIVTTNYDHVLKWANPNAEIVLNSQTSKLPKVLNGVNQNPLIWHLHGHVDDPGSLILARSQYQPLYKGSKSKKHNLTAALAQLKNLISSRHLLFIGFGLEDDYFMEALGDVAEIFDKNLLPKFALLKHNEETQREFWKKYNIQVLGVEDYEQSLIDKIKEIGHLKCPADAITKREENHPEQEIKSDPLRPSVDPIAVAGDGTANGVKNLKVPPLDQNPSQLTYEIVAVEIERLLAERGNAELRVFLQNTCPTAFANNGSIVAVDFRHGTGNVQEVFEQIYEKIGELTASSQVWESLLKIVGGFLTFAINPQWTRERRSAAANDGIEIPAGSGDRPEIRFMPEQDAHILPIFSAALVDGLVRPAQVFGNPGSDPHHLTTDLPQVYKGTREDDIAREKKEIFVKSVLKLTKLAPGEVDRNFKNTLAFMKHSAKKKREPYYTTNDRYRELANAIRDAGFELLDVLQIFKKADGFPEFLISDPQPIGLLISAYDIYEYISRKLPTQ